MITASATGDTITDIGTTLFRTCFKDSFQGGKMGEYVATVLKFTKVAVLTNSGSDYSVGLTDSFVAACKENNVEVVAQESYSAGDTDFKAQLTNIAATDCQAVWPSRMSSLPNRALPPLLTTCVGIGGAER